jgi:hypothetical protein
MLFMVRGKSLRTPFMPGLLFFHVIESTIDEFNSVLHSKLTLLPILSSPFTSISILGALSKKEKEMKEDTNSNLDFI